MSMTKWFMLLIAIIIIIAGLIIYCVKPSSLGGVSERADSNKSETKNSNDASKQKNVADVSKEPNSNKPSPDANPDKSLERINPEQNKNPGPPIPAEIESDNGNANKSETTNSSDPPKQKSVADVPKESKSDKPSPDVNSDKSTEITNPDSTKTPGSDKPLEIESDNGSARKKSETTNSSDPPKQENTDVVSKEHNSEKPSPDTNPDKSLERINPEQNKNPGPPIPAEIESDNGNENKSETTNSSDPPKQENTDVVPKEHNSEKPSPDANPVKSLETINPEQNKNPVPTKPAEIKPDKEEERKLPEENVNDIEDEKTVRKRKLRKILDNKLILEDKYKIIVTDMEEDKDLTFMEEFTDDESTIKINEVSLFGIALLYKYASDNTLPKYLEIVEFLIEHVDRELPNNKIDNYRPRIWGFDWQDISVLFARMLSMYECLGETEAILKICRRRLTEMGPKLGKETGPTPEDIDLVHVMIPRLITDYINDFDLYKDDIKTDIFTRLSSVFDTTENIDDDGEDGLYRDGSYICHKVATFSNLAKFGSFYVNMFRAMDNSTEIDDVVVKLFDKILHPDMDFVPYGLFGREPRITCTDILKLYWPDYKRNARMGVNIFPYIGLGVFKSPKFVFSLRVQRTDIAAYESDPDNFEFAAGWIQMRKLYLKGVDYSKYKNEMKWPELKLQPGVISFADDKYNNFDNLKPETGSLAHLCQGVRSYIGFLVDHNKNLLFWVNNYKFDKIYGDSKVTEYGICTDNGLVIYYSVDNKLAGRELKLRVKDDDIKGDPQMHIETSEDLDGNGYFTLSSTKDYHWRQVFDTNVEPTTITRKSGGKYEFTFNEKLFEFVTKSEEYYILKRNSDCILAGSSSSNPYQMIKLEDENFIRNSDTMMYEVS